MYIVVYVSYMSMGISIKIYDNLADYAHTGDLPRLGETWFG